MSGQPVTVESVFYDALRDVKGGMQTIAEGQARLMESSAGQREQLSSIRESLSRYDQELRDMKRDRETEAIKMAERMDKLDTRMGHHGRVIWLICGAGAIATAIGVGVATDAVTRWSDRTLPAVSAPHKPEEPKDYTSDR